MRRWLRPCGAALLACSAVVLVWPVGAGAEAPDAKAWWYRPQQSGTPVTLPGPPVVPDGGLYVAQGPNSENLAVAAVEYPVTGAATATLTLTPAAGALGTVAVTACPLSAGFTPVVAGAWDQVPAYNCTAAAVNGVVAADGTITFALTPDFVAAGATAVQAALVPTPGSAPFQVPIAPPGDGSFAATSAPAADTPASDARPSGLDSTAPSGSLDAGESALPSFDGSVDTGGTPTSPDVALRPTRARPRPIVPVAVSRQIADRVAAVVGLALIGGAMWWLGGRPSPRPRLLGAGSTGSVPAVQHTARVGGIGRFARPRSGRPNRF